jgi:hypothetical protein
MSYHIYEKHPDNNRPISLLIDDDYVVATYDDEHDVFFITNSTEYNIREELVNEFGEEFTKRILAS